MFALTQFALTLSECYQDHKNMLRIVVLSHILDLRYRMIHIDVHIFTEQSKGNDS